MVGVFKFNAYCRAQIARSHHMLVPWWIMAAYAYERGLDFISDDLFDHIAVRLQNEWDNVEHMHKHLLAREDLKTSLAIDGMWPEMAKGAVWRMHRMRPVEIDALLEKIK